MLGLIGVIQLEAGIIIKLTVYPHIFAGSLKKAGVMIVGE